MPRVEVPDTLMLEGGYAKLALEMVKTQLSYNVENTQRAIGTRLSHIVRRFGMKGLREGHISVRLHGSGGQSLGALRLKDFG